ncbi:MAG: hypothetical protein KGL95_11240 [Patescibacteria group bacterium]|nr:hypothetical protein [Patescibacteria group bacterium]
MAEGEQNKSQTSNSGSVPPFAIIMIVLVIIAGLGVTCFVFFKDKIKSAFSKKDDSNPATDQITNGDNLTDSAVNESENMTKMGDTLDNTAEPKEENPITMPEDTQKIVRPENER